MITVRDNGPGLSSDAQAKMFEPYFTQRAGGTGLGLSICQHLVARMGGSITGATTAAGTEFRIELPIHGSTVERHPQPRVRAVS